MLMLWRYLSPEPLLQEQMYVKGMAQQGMAVPTYAYAFNNPLSYVDPTGLAGTCGPGGIRCMTTATGEISEAGWGGSKALDAAAAAAEAAAAAQAALEKEQQCSIDRREQKCRDDQGYAFTGWGAAKGLSGC